jgi:hypothetical protein
VDGQAAEQSVCFCIPENQVGDTVRFLHRELGLEKQAHPLQSRGLCVRIAAIMDTMQRTLAHHHHHRHTRHPDRPGMLAS